MSETIDLLDWKRKVFALYAEVRAAEPERGWEHWRDVRGTLFREHPQSPRPGFEDLRYFPYDPSLRVLAEVVPAPHEQRQIGSSGETPVTFTRFASARFDGGELELYWLDAYGGGLFLPFRDATAGTETYGAGRYLLDTVKGADLGTVDGRLVLDFNFAYNPSCAYDPKWACPLAPPPNRLTAPIRAGELGPRG
ncbi:MAG: DUF1684 domain-containing protein [Actinobacteria bacterium]|nr:DUF1684 domain-containing protein [Actinomycetota bacterium]